MLIVFYLLMLDIALYAAEPEAANYWMLDSNLPTGDC